MRRRKGRQKKESGQGTGGKGACSSDVSNQHQKWSVRRINREVEEMKESRPCVIRRWDIRSRRQDHRKQINILVVFCFLLLVCCYGLPFLSDPD